MKRRGPLVVMLSLAAVLGCGFESNVQGDWKIDPATWKTEKVRQAGVPPELLRSLQDMVLVLEMLRTRGAPAHLRVGPVAVIGRVLDVGRALHDSDVQPAGPVPPATPLAKTLYWPIRAPSSVHMPMASRVQYERPNAPLPTMACQPCATAS